MKSLTDKKVAALFGITERNMQQTYKNPKPTSTKKEFTAQELEEKALQYKIIRLGATCIEHDVDEELLLSAINFINNIKK